MDIEGRALEVRVYVGESDRRGGVAVSEAVVRFLRENGCAGATVLRGIEGFGAHSRIHTASVLRLSSDLPVVVVAVDREDRIRPLLQELSAMVGGGLVTASAVEVVHYAPPAHES
jgi:PII-like signaling protein